MKMLFNHFDFLHDVTADFCIISACFFSITCNDSAVDSAPSCFSQSRGFTEDT